MATAAASIPFLSAAAFAALLQPYQRIGGVLIREDCCSISASNPYHNLAEIKIGGVMLREGGRVPVRSMQLLIRKAVEIDQLSGWVIGECGCIAERVGGGCV